MISWWPEYSATDVEYIVLYVYWIINYETVLVWGTIEDKSTKKNN
jgi:hypothetical protein